MKLKVLNIKKMKINIIIGSVFILILINNVEGKFNMDGLKKMAKPLKAPCIQQSGVDPELIDAAHKGNFVDDPQLKCYFMCLMQKFKAVKGGKLAVSIMRTQVQALVEDSLAVQMIQVIDACQHHASLHDDLCESSYAYIKCAYEHNSDMKDGEIKIEKIKELMVSYNPTISEADIDSTHAKCVTEAQQKTDKCDMAQEYGKCVDANNIKCDVNVSQCASDLLIPEEEGKKMRADRDFAKERLRCYSVCFMKKSNELDENNKFHIETISKIEHTLYPEKADEIMKAISICIDKVKNIEDKCDLANAYDDCVQGNVNCIPQPPPLTEEMKKNMDECRTELGLTIEEERELHKKRDFDNEKMRCIPACLMKKDGILQDNKEINMDKWYEKIQQFKDLTDDMKKSLQDCYEQVIMNSQLLVLIAFIGFCGFKSIECGMSMDQVENMAKGMRKSCLAKVPVDPQLAVNVRNGQFPEDPNLKCYMRCIAKMSKMIKNGKIDEGVVLAQISLMPVNSDRLIAAAKKCTSITADEECELAYQYVKCNYEQDPEIFFFP
ncbi:uncharacterized protein LOC127286969 [Leptopilina boulardi]|uniref:uncharacterized protein LOC127286969 n=1 Tax=Leptopilina boulardi TaxID=63433 RepID=UPI0021F65E7B|nr:uncharacterized protein LOC127286969 [Leptopilina boulardi]